jgi:hypothetical protein
MPIERFSLPQEGATVHDESCTASDRDHGKHPSSVLERPCGDEDSQKDTYSNEERMKPFQRHVTPPFRCTPSGPCVDPPMIASISRRPFGGKAPRWAGRA